MEQTNAWPAEDRLPVGKVFETLPLTGEHLKACLTLFVVFAIEAWEMMVIVYISPLIATDMDLDPQAVGHLIGAIFAGMGLGALLWGTLCDRIGRKGSIVWSLGLYGIASMLSVFAPDYATLYGLRFLSGVAGVGMLIVTFPYFEELLPVRVRGTWAVYLAAGWPVGMLCALGAALWLGPLGWRWVLAGSSLAALWFIAVLCLVPESPYWLAGTGRQQQAREVIARLSRGALRIPESVQLTVDRPHRGAWRQLFAGRFLRLSLLQIALNFSFAWGYWGLQTWLPTLLQQRGLSLPESYGFIAISALCMIPGYISASYLTGRIGRKPTVIAYIAAAALAGYAFALADSMAVVYAANFALAFFSLGAWGVWDTWIAEIYPTSLRTPGYGWAIFSQRMANIAAPSIIGGLVAQGSSFTATTTLINAFMVISVVLALLLPETEGRELE